MEEQVGNLADGILLYAVFGGNYSLGGLFADLFQYFIEPLVKKVAGIRALLRIFMSLCNYLVSTSSIYFTSDFISLKKQVLLPVWQAGPFCITSISSVSSSQSPFIETTF